MATEKKDTANANAKPEFVAPVSYKGEGYSAEYKLTLTWQNAAQHPEIV